MHYNAAADLLGRNHTRSAKVAFFDDHGSYEYGEVARRIDHFAGYLASLNLPSESRILLCLLDSITFPVACLATIKAGLVPVMVNPLLPSADFDYMLWDSRARALIVSPSAWPSFARIVSGKPELQYLFVADGPAPPGTLSFAGSVDQAKPLLEAAKTRPDEPCLRQYSSGTTGKPKGTIHSHDNVRQLMRLYPSTVLELTEHDITFSAAKLFFGYGFGNGLVFPMSVGATSILMAGRPTAQEVWSRLVKHGPTVFYGVPTLYALLLDSRDAPRSDNLSLRLCTSAGEALPKPLAERWKGQYETDILDGIGSTEMFHIFLSNRPNDIAYGTSGRAVGGYELRLVGDDGAPVCPGSIGEIHIKGPTSALGYWCNRKKTSQTFLGSWTRTGDKFLEDENDRYVYCGRSDDMLKVSGIYVSPIEVETALMSRPSVREAAVVGWADAEGLIKPNAFVVVHDGTSTDAVLEKVLKSHVKETLAPYKYPRRIEFLSDLPKTPTGKIERYKLRRPGPS